MANQPDPNRAPISIRFDREKLEEMRQTCANEGTSMQAVVEELAYKHFFGKDGVKASKARREAILETKQEMLIDDMNRMIRMVENLHSERGIIGESRVKFEEALAKRLK